MVAAVRLPAVSFCCPRTSARETAVSFQPGRPFFSQSTFVVRCDSNEQLPCHWRSGCRQTVRFFVLLSTAFNPRNGRQSSTKTAVFLSLIERKSRQKKERIWIRQKKKRRPLPTARKAAFHFAYRNNQHQLIVPKGRHCGDGAPQRYRGQSFMESANPLSFFISIAMPCMERKMWASVQWRKTVRITTACKSAPRHCENAWRRRELLRCPQRSFRVNFLCCAMPHSGNVG